MLKVFFSLGKTDSLRFNFLWEESDFLVACWRQSLPLLQTKFEYYSIYFIVQILSMISNFYWSISLGLPYLIVCAWISYWQTNVVRNAFFFLNVLCLIGVRSYIEFRSQLLCKRNSRDYFGTLKIDFSPF